MNFKVMLILLYLLGQSGTLINQSGDLKYSGPRHAIGSPVRFTLINLSHTDLYMQVGAEARFEGTISSVSDDIFSKSYSKKITIIRPLS